MTSNIKRLIIKVLSILALLGTVAWFCSNPSWEPAVTFIISLAALITTEAYDYKASSRNPDIELYRKFISELPYEGGIRFIKDWNMAGFAFFRKELDDLFKFSYEWNDASHEFIDKKLEKIKKQLHILISEYVNYSALNTWPVPGGLQTVPPEWEIEQPKRFLEVVEKLHSMAEEIVRTHQEFIRLAKKRLRV